MLFNLLQCISDICTLKVTTWRYTYDWNRGINYFGSPRRAVVFLNAISNPIHIIAMISKKNCQPKTYIVLILIKLTFKSTCISRHTSALINITISLRQWLFTVLGYPNSSLRIYLFPCCKIFITQYLMRNRSLADLCPGYICTNATINFVAVNNMQQQAQIYSVKILLRWM